MWFRKHEKLITSAIGLACGWTAVLLIIVAIIHG